MKVCHIVWGMPIGGAENLLVDIINRQIKEAEINLIVVDAGYNKDLIERLDKRIKIFLLERTIGKKDLLTILRLNLILFCNKFQIIHCHRANLFTMILIRPLLTGKICLTVHDTNIVYSRLKRFDKIFSISRAVKDDILKRDKLESTKIINGIDFNIISRKTKHTANKRALSIIQVSRLNHKKKGQELLIKALHELLFKHDMPDIEVTFIGEGPSKDYLVKLARDLGVLHKCNFIGPKDRNFVYATLSNYDLLVQPSHFEGFGLTVAEGIAAMIPVLVSDIEGPADIIEQGKYGYMFKKGDSSDLALKILQVFEDSMKPDFIVNLETAYHYAKKRFDVSNTTQSYLQEYAQLC